MPQARPEHVAYTPRIDPGHLVRHCLAATLVAAISTSLPAQPVFAPDYEGFSLVRLTDELVPIEAPLQLVGIRETPDGHLLFFDGKGVVYVRTADGTFLDTPFLDHRNQVSALADGGLSDLAYDPASFQAGPGEPHFVYLLYAVDPNADGVDDEICRWGRLSRMETDPERGNLVAQASREVSLIGGTWPEGILLGDIYHLNDGIAFGTDGTLLFSAGDSNNVDRVRYPDCFGEGRTPLDQSIEPHANNVGRLRPQYPDSYNGKVLRIDRATGLGLPSNPLYDGDPDSIRSRVWTMGLRNPWRFCVVPGTGSTDPADGDPGTLLIGDVGNDIWEEVIVSAAAGENFGWPYYEYTTPFQNYLSLGPNYAQVMQPADAMGAAALAFHHTVAGSNEPAGVTPERLMFSVAMGVVYQGTGYPERFRGRAYFGGTIRRDFFELTLDEEGGLVSCAVVATGFPGSIMGIVDISPRHSNGNFLLSDYRVGYELVYSPAPTGALVR